MKEELYQWMKNLAVFYILLTSLLHLVPEKEYQRYIRLFMGLMLIFMLCMPVFTILGKGGDLVEGVARHYQQETIVLEQEAAEQLQQRYLEKGLIFELKEQIKTSLEKRKINPMLIQVSLEKEQVTAVIYMEKEPEQEEKERIADGLMEACQIGQGQYQIKVLAHGPAAVGSTSSGGTSAGSDGSSGIS